MGQRRDAARAYPVDAGLNRTGHSGFRHRRMADYLPSRGPRH